MPDPEWVDFVQEITYTIGGRSILGNRERQIIFLKATEEHGRLATGTQKLSITFRDFVPSR